MRSEGIDRRRRASLVADREACGVEGQLVSGGFSTNDSRERGARTPSSSGATATAGLLPASAREESPGGRSAVPTLLVDEKGQSRVQRLSVVVKWDESGEPDHVERTTYALDTSQLADLFPPEGGSEGGSEDGSEDESKEANRSLSELRKQSPPELQQLIDRSQQDSK